MFIVKHALHTVFNPIYVYKNNETMKQELKNLAKKVENQLKLKLPDHFSAVYKAEIKWVKYFYFTLELILFKEVEYINR